MTSPHHTTTTTEEHTTMSTASPKQINLINRLFTGVTNGVEALPEGDSAVIAVEALLASQQASLIKVLSNEDLDSRAASSLIDILFAAEKVVPPTEVRWVKEGDTFLLKGSASVLVPGAVVTVTSSKGEKLVTVGTVARTEGHTVFATPAPDAPGAGSGLDLTALFDGLLTGTGEQRTDIWVADPEGDEYDNRLKLHISAPRSGKWAGWVFVKDAAVYGYGGKYGCQRPGATYSGKAVEVLARVLADRNGAMARYGTLVGSCGVCGRVLEDKDSIARGIGPDCAKRI
jgi:hypothetical protein